MSTKDPPPRVRTKSQGGHKCLRSPAHFVDLRERGNKMSSSYTSNLDWRFLNSHSTLCQRMSPGEIAATIQLIAEQCNPFASPLRVIPGRPVRPKFPEYQGNYGHHPIDRRINPADNLKT